MTSALTVDHIYKYIDIGLVNPKSHRLNPLLGG